MTIMKALGRLATTTAHFLDHPGTIRAAEKAVPLVYWLGAPALLIRDVYKAEGAEEKRKVALRDTLVLGGTLLGTVFGTRWLMKEEHEFAQRGMEALQQLKGKYSEAFTQQLKGLLSKSQEALPFKDFRKGFWGMWNEGLAAAKEANTPEERQLIMDRVKADLHTVFPLGQAEEESFKEQILKAGAFFAVGLLSVIGGTVGGLLANKMNQGDSQTKVNILKEAAFQFIANIAMCAVGAIVGVSAVRLLAKKVNPIFDGRLFRIPIVSAGLSIGICGGGVIANYLGRTVINPICEWTDSANRTWQDLKDRIRAGMAHVGNSRHIEFSDIILHLDDLPTALAIAGMKVMGPFIPPFFAFSGYRAGIGYRNKAESPDETTPAPAFGHQQSPSRRNHPSPLMAQNSVFRTFYDHQKHVG